MNKEIYYTHLNSSHSDLIEIARVGKFKNFYISIYGSEGPIPHFHFKSLNEEIEGCIRLDKPEYFKHNSYDAELNSKDRKKLVEWLKSPHKSFGSYGATNWQVICIYWNDNNEKFIFNSTEMPDYTQLK